MEYHAPKYWNILKTHYTVITQTLNSCLYFWKLPVRLANIYYIYIKRHQTPIHIFLLIQG